jgi:hypothetical protein
LLGNDLRFVISTCHEIHDELSHQIVLDNLINLEMFEFDEESEEYGFT